MNPEVRKSAATKISAIGFIILILSGNLWLVYAILGSQVPFWVSYGFTTGVAVTALGGIALVVKIMTVLFVSRNSD